MIHVYLYANAYVEGCWGCIFAKNVFTNGCKKITKLQIHAKLYTWRQIYTHIHTCALAHRNTHDTHINTHIYTHSHTHTHAITHTHTNTKHAHTHSHIYTQKRTRTHTYTNIHTQTQTHTHTHTYIDTRAHAH